jgi:hypothetical protein
MTGYDHELDQRPPVANGSGKFYPVHRAGHPDVGEDDPDVFAVFKYLYRVIAFGA